jgi:cardiolipin synthase
LVNDGENPLTTQNDVQLLINGEEKFPAFFAAIEGAKDHIHLAYYIIEYDELGTRLLDLLMKKAGEGVAVRLLYDDFGSKPVRGAFADQLRSAGGEAVPFNKVKIFSPASKINYRNHRKIAVIDGQTGYVGGINLCDKYINTGAPGKLYWRDTHLKIRGEAVFHLQHIFLSDWNFSAGQRVAMPVISSGHVDVSEATTPVQIVAGGPDCPRSVIRLSMLKAINLARESVYITTPYFIPDGSIVSALKLSALSGVDVRILVPDVADSFTVNAAARSYYGELLKAGVSIYLYEKGFVHAKTMVVDRQISVVGTANMDIRSFDINFEVNANVYNAGIANQLGDAFLEDLQFSRKLDYGHWKDRPWTKVLPERLARLFSPLL